MPCSHPFTPPKLSAYVDEAKTYAAEYTLQTLGIPTDGADAPSAAAATTAFPGREDSTQPRVFEKPPSVPGTLGVVFELHPQ